jgi:hypothetical protein
MSAYHPRADPGAGTKRTVFAFIEEHDTTKREQQQGMGLRPLLTVTTLGLCPAARPV